MPKPTPKPGDPYLSIIIPVFNGEKYIKDTLESLSLLRKSAVGNLEIIFQNGLSTDGTPGLIDAYCSANPDSHHYYEKDNGQSDAINKGISRARGKWVTWLCADDLVLPNLWQALQEADHVQADIVYGDVLFIVDDHVIPAIGTETHLAGRLARERLIIQQPGTCLRNNVWHELGGVNLKLNWMMDYDLFLRLESMNKRFYRARQFVAAATIHKDAKTSSGSIKRLLEIWSIIVRSHLRRIRYFRLKPYYVYLMEYIIKNIESRDLQSKLWLKIIGKLHSFFWLLALPKEKVDIEERYSALPEDLTSYLERVVSRENPSRPPFTKGGRS